MRPFVMERWQSHWENRVRFNLSESGVHPLTLGELLELAGAEAAALGTPLGYGQTNGTETLRARIAAHYEGATAADVVVTNGGAEANFLVGWHLVRPGDVVAVLTPTYMQLPGLAEEWGAELRSVPLLEELGWQPDPDAVGRAIDDRTRLVVVTNPQNPTGMRLTETSIAAVLGAAERVGAWVLADEVYAGAEVGAAETPSLFGRYERVIATGSLSKAYGLPGLRIGWLVARGDAPEAYWGRKDYTTISPGALTDALAAMALREDVRPRLLERTRAIVAENLAVVRQWIDGQAAFHLAGHEAGAICFPSYDLPIPSEVMAERLRVEQDTLIVPGSQFDMGRYVRIGFGIERRELEEALGRVGELASSL